MRRRSLLVGLALLACKKVRRAPGPSPEGDKDTKSAARVVSISPSTTEAVCALGARALLVGRSRYCDYPPEIKSVPEVGGYVDPNLEAILALAPDLVTGARGPAGAAITDALAARGVATFFPRTESFGEIEEMIMGLGDRLGRAPDAAAFVASMRADRAALDVKLADKPAPRALLVFGVDPIVVAGPGTFADEMLTRAHAKNAVTDGSGYPTLGIERVLGIDPDVIIEAAFGERGRAAIAKDAPGWGKLRAVRAERVHHLDDESVLRPGPRAVKGAETIARAVHGTW